MNAPSGQSVVLAAGTVDGSGTMVALSSALLHLTAVAETRKVTAVVPSKRIGVAGEHSIELRRSSRRQALLDEAIGRPAGDVYVGFADRLPLRSASDTYYVMVVQNPHLYGAADEWAEGHQVKHAVLSRWAKHSAKRADLVICSTDASRVDVIAATGVDPAKIVVRPIPARPIDAAKTEHRTQIERVLNVGDLYDYKRADVALDAVTEWSTSQGRSIEFVHIGRSVETGAEQAFVAAEVRAEAAGVVVTRLGRLSNDEVFAEMVAADVLMLPSTTESQGLPLVEALSVGLPTICRAIPVFLEQGGDHVISVGNSEPSDRFADVRAFAEGLAVLATSDVRERLGRGALAAHEPQHAGWDLLPKDL